MEDFIYYAPTKVVFGKNKENEVANLIKPYNPNKVLIHYGMGSVIKSGLLAKVKSILDANNIKYVELGGVQPNPTVDLVRKGIKLCQDEKVDFILAVGGGSVIDSAKDIANGVANPDVDVWDFSIKKAEPKATLHKGAILTLAAAGSEMSDSSVITNPETEIKNGYCSPLNRLDFAIENPELTYSVNKYQTACGAVDISMHTIERYFDIGESELTDSVALAIIKNVFKNGLICYKEPTNYEARANMMWASSISHNGLTGCGKEFLLTVHQLEHTLSGMYPNIAHGAGLAALWCSWARLVYKSNIDRWYHYAKEIWDETSLNKEEAILSAINKQENYYHSIGMPISLKELNVKQEDMETLAIRCSQNKTRIIKGFMNLGYEQILEIYKTAY